MLWHARQELAESEEDTGSVPETGTRPSDSSGLRCAPPVTERDLRDAEARSRALGEEPTLHALHDEQEVNEDHATLSFGEESVSTTRPRPPANHLPDLPPHLVVRKVLGQGGTAVVYEALHTRLNVRVAVKVLAPAGPHEGEARERLLREAELYARLSDPRFPRVYDVDELPDGTPFVVMEFIEGRTLAEALLFGPLEVDATYAITREILEALMEIHQAGIVHRDIKPSNILLEGELGEEPRVRLVDFGIAKTVLPAHAAHSLTQQGTMLGTPHYMAPEQITAQSMDERVDIYAVGVVLYELLAGRMPFDGPTVGEVIASALRDTPRALAELREDIPAPLERVVERAMARDRDQRYGSAHEMLHALNAARLEWMARPALAADVVPPVAEASPVDAPLPLAPEHPEHVLLIVPEEEEDEVREPAPPAVMASEPARELDDESQAMAHRLKEVGERDPEWVVVRAAALLCLGCALLWPMPLVDEPPPLSQLRAEPAAAAAPVLPAPIAPSPGLPATQLPAASAPAAEPLPAPAAVAAPATLAAPAAVDEVGAPEAAELMDEAATPRPAEVAPGPDDEESARETRRARRARRSEPTRALQPATSVAPNPYPPAESVTPRLEMRKPPESNLNLPANPY